MIIVRTFKTDYLFVLCTNIFLKRSIVLQFFENEFIKKEHF